MMNFLKIRNIANMTFIIALVFTFITTTTTHLMAYEVSGWRCLISACGDVDVVAVVKVRSAGSESPQVEEDSEDSG